MSKTALLELFILKFNFNCKFHFLRSIRVNFWRLPPSNSVKMFFFSKQKIIYLRTRNRENDTENVSIREGHAWFCRPEHRIMLDMLPDEFQTLFILWWKDSWNGNMNWLILRVTIYNNYLIKRTNDLMFKLFFLQNFTESLALKHLPNSEFSPIRINWSVSCVSGLGSFSCTNIGCRFYISNTVSVLQRYICHSNFGY